MSTSNTHSVTLSADAAQRWRADKRTRDRILFIARNNARQLGQTRIEILDESRNVLRVVEPPKPAPGSARIPFVEHDGGRAASGFKGTARGDCVTRAIAIATGKPYREVYDALNELAKRERPRGKTKRSSASNGVHRVTYERYLFGLGFKFVPTMAIGAGCKVHLRADELPKTGRLVLSLSRHLAAVVDGTLFDADDCSRLGTRCVYGYYVAPEVASLGKAA